MRNSFIEGEEIHIPSQENAIQMYAFAKEKSNKELYKDAADMFSQAASIFERQRENIWAAKAFSCASWNLIPLKEFQTVKSYLDKSVELDNCRGIEGLLHAMNYCLYYEQIERQKANKVDEENYRKNAEDYLSLAISVIYEWKKFNSYELNNHLKKINAGLVQYLNYITEEFFSEKLKQEKRINPEWVQSNKARHARTKNSLGQDHLGLGESFERANLQRFSKTVKAIDFLRLAESEPDFRKAINEIDVGVTSLPSELMSLPAVTELRNGVEKLKNGGNVDIKPLLIKAINSLNDLYHSAAREITVGILAEELKKRIVNTIRNKIRPFRVWNIAINIAGCILVFVLCLIFIATDFWIKIAPAVGITALARYFIEKVFPFKIR